VIERFKANPNALVLHGSETPLSIRLNFLVTGQITLSGTTQPLKRSANSSGAT
jgi:hypothetical protein